MIKKIDFNWYEEFAEYRDIMEKYNVYGSTLNQLDSGDYKITLTEQRFEKLGRKNFPRKATEEKTEVIQAINYGRYISSIGFFRDRVEQSYTFAGYIPMRLTSVSPDREIKIVRKFYIEKIK